MTDAEVICGWMEPKPPTGGRIGRSRTSPGVGVDAKYEWWWYEHGAWHPIFEWIGELSYLGMLHEVEERLTEEQKRHYISHVASLNGLEGRFYEDAWVFLHASAEQKIKALAAVLREGGASNE